MTTFRNVCLVDSYHDIILDLVICVRHDSVAPMNECFRYFQQHAQYAKHILQILLLLHLNLNILPIHSKIPKKRNQNSRKLWFCHSYSRVLEEQNSRNIWKADRTKLRKTLNSAAATWRKSKFYFYKLLTYDSLQNSCQWQNSLRKQAKVFF